MEFTILHSSKTAAWKPGQIVERRYSRIRNSPRSQTGSKYFNKLKLPSWTPSETRIPASMEFIILHNSLSVRSYPVCRYPKPRQNTDQARCARVTSYHDPTSQYVIYDEDKSTLTEQKKANYYCSTVSFCFFLFKYACYLSKRFIVVYHASLNILFERNSFLENWVTRFKSKS